MSGAHAFLRSATAPDHERLDALFERFDLGTRADYGHFLSAHAAAIVAVEEALDAADIARLLPDWNARKRGALIRADLASLGLEVPAALPAPPLGDAGAAWGAAYVVEGSRLGGAVLARRVAKGLPTAYLAAPQPKGAWRTFLAMLDEAVATAEGQAGATAGAHATFGLFEIAGRRQLEISGG